MFVSSSEENKGAKGRELELQGVQKSPPSTLQMAQAVEKGPRQGMSSREGWETGRTFRGHYSREAVTAEEAPLFFFF